METEGTDVMSLVEMKRKNKIWIYGLVGIISLARIGHGLFMSISGPTLLFLADNVNTDVAKASTMFTGRSVGVLVGSVGFSLVVNRFPKFKPLLSLGIGLGINGIMVLLTPFTSTLAGLITVTTIGGLAFGYLDAGLQAVYLTLWGEEKSRPYIQSVHFGFSVGALLAPLLAKPFLEMASEDTEDDASCPNANNNEATTVSIITSSYENKTSFGDNDEGYFNPINWCYVIVGVYIIVMSLCLVVMALLNVEKKVITDHKGTVEMRKEETLNELKYLFLFVLLYYFCCESTEAVYASYIYSIALCSDLHFSVSDASLLNTLFWTGFMIGRGSAIIHSNYFKPTTIIIYDLCGVLLALIIMVVFGEDIALVTWLATFYHGLCVATLYSCGVSWTSHVTNMAGSYMFLFAFGNSLGAMTMLPAAGALFDQNPFSVIHLLCGLAAANIIFFIVMNVIAIKRPHHDSEQKVFEKENEFHQMSKCKTNNECIVTTEF